MLWAPPGTAAAVDAEVAGSAAATEAALADFARLWDLVAVGQASRGTQQEPAPPVQHVCQYGVSNATMAIADFLLGSASPSIDQLTLFEEAEGSRRARESSFLAGRLMESDRTGRVRLGPLPPGELCDLVVFSTAAPLLTVERILEVVGEYAVVAWVSDECTTLPEDQVSPACNLQGTLWERSALMLRGYCLARVCMSRVPSNLLKDPNVVPLQCDRFNTLNGSHFTTAEFGQDWYLFWNFFRHGAPNGEGEVERGFYVDVGASLPFDYSNTVVLDRCFGWQGLCVEPNPYLASFQRAYRSCKVMQFCVDAEAHRGRSFVDRDGKVEFVADCLPLGKVLRLAGLHGRTVDLLSIDVEHAELGVLQGLTLEEFHIRFIVVEVSRGARWLEVDTILLPKGYAKIAVLGRDVVYARLEELAKGGFASWPFLAGGRAQLPEDWAHFHQRVVDEELEEEMRQERAAFYAGLRRR